MREVAWPDPTPEMLFDPRFEAVWQCIKRWDISVPDAYSGYMGATGNHVRAILDAIHPAWREIERLRSLVQRPDVDTQAIAAIAWRCIRECKDYEGPPVMCPAHQEEARTLVANCGEVCAQAWCGRCEKVLPECDEPAKPEAGPMQDTESLSGVQALGSSGLALARAVILDLRASALRMESSLRGDLAWLWRGKAIGYETALIVLDRHAPATPALEYVATCIGEWRALLIEADSMLSAHGHGRVVTRDEAIALSARLRSAYENDSHSPRS